MFNCPLPILFRFFAPTVAEHPIYLLIFFLKQILNGRKKSAELKIRNFRKALDSAAKATKA